MPRAGITFAIAGVQTQSETALLHVRVDGVVRSYTTLRPVLLCPCIYAYRNDLRAIACAASTLPCPTHPNAQHLSFGAIRCAIVPYAC